MVGALRSDDDRRNCRATVVGTYVEDAVRGRGIGRRLFEALLEHFAHDEDVAIAKLGVNRDQEAAVRLYTAAGFQVVGEGIVTLGDGHHTANSSWKDLCSSGYSDAQVGHKVPMVGLQTALDDLG